MQFDICMFRSCDCPTLLRSHYLSFPLSIIQLHAMHLKSIGAIAARTLSYSACEFDMVDNVGSKKVRKVYDQSAELWTDLHTQLADRCAQLKEDEQVNKRIAALENREDGVLTEDLLYHRDLHADSDTEGEDSDDEDEGIAEQKRLRRKFRNRKSKTLKVSGLTICFSSVTLLSSL